MGAWLLLVPAYLLGTVPTAVWVARSKGIDIHEVGSGNPGASNIARVLGARWGVVVFLGDALKGMIPAIVALAMHRRVLAYALVGAAIIGHIYPVTRRWRGGRGVATLGGGAVVLMPVGSLLLLVVWVIVRNLTHKASLASLVVMVGMPVAVALTGHAGWEVAAMAALCLMVAARHGDNIRRLLGGKELSASR